MDKEHLPYIYVRCIQEVYIFCQNISQRQKFIKQLFYLKFHQNKTGRIKIYVVKLQFAQQKIRLKLLNHKLILLTQQKHCTVEPYRATPSGTNIALSIILMKGSYRIQLLLKNNCFFLSSTVTIVIVKRFYST